LVSATCFFWQAEYGRIAANQTAFGLDMTRVVDELFFVLASVANSLLQEEEDHPHTREQPGD